MALTTEQITHVVQNLGFSHLNTIQNSAIAAAAEHKAYMLVAPTGSGKTVAYLLGALQFIQSSPGVQALVIVPTRELALQIEDVAKKMRQPFKTVACYGGRSMAEDRNNLLAPPTLLIGTPGRLAALLREKAIGTDTIHQLVLDEFDKSLELGFNDDMAYIIEQLPSDIHQCLVSATTSIKVPEFVGVAPDLPKVQHETTAVSKQLNLYQITAPAEEKLELLITFLHTLKLHQNAIIFCNHRDACERISTQLNALDCPFSLYHGGLNQSQREYELATFRNKSALLMVATDLAARGLDIPGLDFVVHYQLPDNEAAYTHRNGRTARMKATGTAILITTDEEALPEFIATPMPQFNLTPHAQMATPPYTTLYINKGKKDKINKVDLVGFFTQFEGVNRDSLGLIEVKAHHALVAIKRELADNTLKLTKGKKIKKKAVRIWIP